jgi:hypothetical protein
MQSRAARLGLLAIVIVAAVVVFVVLKNNNSDESSDTAKGVQVLNVDASGNPVGGVKTLTYNKGDQVELHVNLAKPEEGPRPRLRDREAGRAQSGDLLVPGQPRWGVRDRGAPHQSHGGPDRRAPRQPVMRAPKLKLAVGLAIDGPAAVFVAASVLLVGLLFPDVASAHALVGRKDLPVPAWLFAWGASLVLIISFALLSVAWTTARLQKEDWRPTPRWFSRPVLNAGTQLVCGLIGVGLFVVVLYSGFRASRTRLRTSRSSSSSTRSGWAWSCSACLRGRVPGFNPWRDRPDDLGGFRLVAGQSSQVPFGYPERLGRWPLCSVSSCSSGWS